MRSTRLIRRLLLSLASAAAAGCGDQSEITGPHTPPSPNFVRLQSDLGDYIGAGQAYNYTQADADIVVAASGGHLSIQINGDQWWFGDFEVPSALSRLQPGNYTNLQRYPFHDRAKGGLDWFGEGRGCNTLSGSFSVDSVTYVKDTLTTIDLHFEQHCEGVAAALRGTIHWRSDDATGPPGPVNPIPANLWRPAPGSTPSAGDYVYLNSDAGDYIGAGLTYTYTPLNATIGVTANGGLLSVMVSGWTGDFRAMSTLSQLEVGYYPDLQRYPFNNPRKGGLDWSGQGRGCNTLQGWFAIDGVTYTSGTLTAIDLRFEQHCEGGTPALHGAIHWRG